MAQDFYQGLLDKQAADKAAQEMQMSGLAYSPALNNFSTPSFNYSALQSNGGNGYNGLGSSLKGLGSYFTDMLGNKDKISTLSDGVGAIAGIYDLGEKTGLWKSKDTKQNEKLMSQKIAANDTLMKQHDAFLKGLKDTGLSLA